MTTNSDRKHCAQEPSLPSEFTDSHFQQICKVLHPEICIPNLAVERAEALQHVGFTSSPITREVVGKLLPESFNAPSSLLETLLCCFPSFSTSCPDALLDPLQEPSKVLTLPLHCRGKILFQDSKSLLQLRVAR